MHLIPRPLLLKEKGRNREYLLVFYQYTVPNGAGEFVIHDAESYLELAAFHFAAFSLRPGGLITVPRTRDCV